jgi:hypothetical protein
LIKSVAILLVLQAVLLAKLGNANAGVVRVCLVFPYSLMAAAARLFSNLTCAFEAGLRNQHQPADVQDMSQNLILNFLRPLSQTGKACGVDV